jgi:uridine kinase
MIPSNQPYIIGVAGGTASGKTTMAMTILKNVDPDRVVYIAHDSYYKDLSHLSEQERFKTNFDHPDAFDTHLLVQHLIELRAGRPVDVPVYDFRTCTRLSDTQHVEPKDVIIVEGILTLADETLRNQFDLRIYVELSEFDRFIRRVERDMSERGRTFASIKEQWYATVRPMHNQFIGPSKRYAEILVPGEVTKSEALDTIAGQVLAKIAAARLQVLGEMGQRLLLAEYEEVKEEIVELAAQELGASSVTLHQYDVLQGDFLDPGEFSATWPPGGHLEKPRKGGATAYVVEKGTVAVTDIDDEQHQELVKTAHLAETDTKAFLGIRLEAGGETLGVLFLNYLSPREFGPEERTVAGILGAYAATAIHRARLYEQIEQRAARLQVLGEMGQRLLLVEYEEVKEEIVELAAQELGASSVTLHQYDVLQGDFLDPGEFSATWPPGGHLEKPRKGGATAYVVEKGTVAVTDIDDEQHQELVKTAHLAETDTKAFLGIRLEAGGETLGVLFLNYLSPREFGPEERTVAGILGAYAATAIHRARLLERHQAEQQAKRQAEKALDQVLIDIVHYIKNIAGLIRLDSSEILEDLKDGEFSLPPLQHTKLNEIYENAEAVIDKVKRSLSSRKPPSPRWIGVEELITETKEWIQKPGLAAGIELQVGLPPDLPKVYTDVLRTTFVFAEIIMNAQRAIISAEVEHGLIQITARPSGKGNYVEILFTNNGPAIPRQYWERIFEGLRLGSEGVPSEVSGTGLWRARTILDAQGGGIQVLESGQSSTTFVVRLPISPPRGP